MALKSFLQTFLFARKNKEEFEDANAMYEKYKKNHSGVIEIIFSQEDNKKTS